MALVGTINAPNDFGFTNRIINGAMVIDQRNVGASKTYSAAEGVYNVDRWQAGAIGGGTFTTQQMNSANTSASNYEASSAPTGFTNSLKITVGTADTSLASSDRYSIYQYIEGNNVQDLDFGIATAKTVTVSFWTKSSVVGTFGVYLSNAAFSRSIPSTFTINAINTWEYKTITFVGDVTGTWLKGDTTGLVLGFSFAMGTTYQGTKDTWAATAYFTTSSQTNFMATSSNTFYITGVQLEKGATATSFGYRSYTTELQLCQRYCYVFRSDAVATFSNIGFASVFDNINAHVGVTLPVPMRIVPTITYSSISDLAIHAPGLVRIALSTFSVNTNQSSNIRAVVGATTASNANFVNLRACHCEFNGTSVGWLAFGSEL